MLTQSDKEVSYYITILNHVLLWTLQYRISNV